jgi:hypothetical protein
MKIHLAAAAAMLAFLLPVASPGAVYWGDLHAHSNLSNDATGTPDNLFTVARDVIDLDFVALTDHDIVLDLNEWDILRTIAASFNDEGTFVAFSANEWTRVWHMNAYFQADDPPLCKSCTAASFNIAYSAYVGAGTAAAHVNHPLDPPYPVDWSEIDDAVTTNVEVWNAGSGDNEIGFGGALWALQAGFRLGFVGVSDDHHVDQPPLSMGNGITGCRAAALTRADLLAELRARRCWATNGERIELDVDVDGTPMGGELSIPLHTSVTVTVAAVGTDTPTAIEVVRNGTVVATKTDCAGPACTFAAAVEVAEPHTFFYARVRQAGDKTAWSSPVWVRGECVAPGDCPLSQLARGGGAAATDCVAEWLVLPATDTRSDGTPLDRVTCQDGDPTCDADSTPGECTLRVGICLGMSDSRLPACTPVAVDTYDVLRPSANAAGTDEANLQTLRAALRALGAAPPAGSCTPAVALRVPVAVSSGGSARPGRRRFKGRARAGGATDRDSLTLVCTPS